MKAPEGGHSCVKSPGYMFLLHVLNLKIKSLSLEDFRQGMVSKEFFK